MYTVRHYITNSIQIYSELHHQHIEALASGPS